MYSIHFPHFSSVGSSSFIFSLSSTVFPPLVLFRCCCGPCSRPTRLVIIISWTSCLLRKASECRNIPTSWTPRTTKGGAIMWSRWACPVHGHIEAMQFVWSSSSFPLWQSKFSFQSLLLQQLVHGRLVAIFARHGAVSLSPPLLNLQSSSSSVESAAQLMDSSGTILTLPYDHRVIYSLMCWPTIFFFSIMLAN